MTATWQVQEAKARLRTVIEQARAHQPQTITQRGEPVAIVVDAEDFARLTSKPGRGRLTDALLNAPQLFSHDEVQELFGRDRTDSGRDFSFED